MGVKVNFSLELTNSKNGYRNIINDDFDIIIPIKNPCCTTIVIYL
jgi:hypothetical protein